MTARIEIRYITGRAHGTPWGISHNEGAIEFPPSPWRLFRALLSVWHERAPEISEDVVRSLLSKLASTPVTYKVPQFVGSHVRHYFPDSSHLGGVATSTAKVLDAFAAVDPSTPLDVEWDVDLAPAERSAFEQLASLLPYLGRAESLVDARATASPSNSESDGRRTVSEGSPTDPRERPLRLLCPEAELDFDSLVDVPWKVRQKGFVLPRGAALRSFVADGPLEHQPIAPPARRQRTVHLIEWTIRGKGKIPITATVGFCDTLRYAALKPFSDRGDDVGWQVTGKQDGTRAEQHHAHAHFLPVATAGFLTGLMMWIPAGIDLATAEQLAAPPRLWAPRREGVADLRDVSLYLQRIASLPAQTHLAAFQSSHVWETVTPYAPAKHLRPGGRMMSSLARCIATDLAEIGLPAPVEVDLVAKTPHALDFRRHRVKEKLRDGRRAYHVRLSFDSEVAGPISIGALSHFGLGHFCPADK
jgi:CRISPR-associated protein Csb2